MKTRIKSNKSLVRNRVFFALIMVICLCLAGCQRAHPPLTDIDSSGSRLPKVALAPLQIQLPKASYFPKKELVQEAGDHLLAKNFAQGSFLVLSTPSFLQSQKRVPIYSLWHGADLRSSKMLLPHDFIVLVEIKRFDLKRFDENPDFQHQLRGFRQIKPLYYEVQVYVRIVDMTGPEPTLAMQEHLEWQIPVSMGQAQSDEQIENWRDTSFDRTGIACVLVKLCQEISDRSKGRIDAAWTKRLPFSRMAKRSF